MIQLTPAGRTPVYEQICAEVRRAIADGALARGDRLTPIRDLARQLGLNSSTVARAYRMLEQQGLVETHKGGGTIVALNPPAAQSQEMREARLSSLVEEATATALAQGYSPDEIEAAMALQLAATRLRRSREQGSQRAVDDEIRLHRFAGSHDLALETLWAHARQAHPATDMEVRYVGSLDGLLVVLRG